MTNGSVTVIVWQLLRDNVLLAWDTRMARQGRKAESEWDLNGNGQCAPHSVPREKLGSLMDPFSCQKETKKK
ncbi:unnamed protein product [Cuscuta campestris]|uniref:Uncharacterized protein n=1 Tax=Cuscuta campestris TaxID=132261 RepID=A0A484L4J0_9ASTE|nr:unnamed protein product [Cuscuta campestris]